MRDYRTSLLHYHPDGLGKHLQIFKDCKISTKDVVELHEIGDIPFYIRYEGNDYLAILGSDITCQYLKEEDYGQIFTILKVSEVLNESKWFLQRAWDYLGWKRDKITLCMIGHAQ